MALIDLYLACAGRTLSFAWGERDCWTLVSGWLKVRQHQKVADAISRSLGTYRTAEEFAERAQRAGLMLTPDNVARRLPVKLRTGLPKPGDIALLHTSQGWTLGLVSSDGRIVMRGKRGLRRLRVFRSAVFFRVN